MQRTTYKKQFLFWLFLSSVAVMSAQEAGLSPAATEKMKMTWVWNQSSNAAGLKLDPSKSYATLSGGYTLENGNYHRVMEGDKNKSLTLNTEGGVNIRDFYFWGRFDYTRNAVKDARFNASLINPYRGMPYFVADTLSSDWNNQYYELEYKINFPAIGEKWLFGVGGEYYAYLAAKQRDIRTENYAMKLSVRPGVVYSVNSGNHIGLNLEYGVFKEESNMSNVNVYIDQPFYELRGLGNAIIGIGSGRTTNYIRKSLGAGLQYHFSGSIDLMLTGNYLTSVEDAEVSFTNPRKEGTVVDRVWHQKASLKTKGEDHTHYLDLEYIQRMVKGIEYVTKFDDTETFKGYVTLYKSIRSTYASKFLSVGYSWTKNQGDEYTYLLGGKVNYTDLDDNYLLPKSRKHARNIIFEGFGKRNFTLSDRLSKKLLVGTRLIYGKNIDGSYLYGGAYKEYPIHSQLEKRDNEYDTSGFFAVHLSGVYSQKINRSADVNVYVRADASYAKAQNKSFGNRNMLSFSIGCNF